MADSITSTALDTAAPAEERYDAQAALTKSALSVQDQLFGRPEVRETIETIREMLFEQDLAKAGSNLIIGPWGETARKKPGERGPKSVILDDYQIIPQGGGYWDRPGVLSFAGMRGMVEQTPILNSIILTRIRQVARFCRPQIDDNGPGFVIKHVDPNVKLDQAQQQSVQLLQKFMLNCGWEFDPRNRKRMKRDNLRQFMAKSVRDTLVLDACPIETEFKRDRSLGIDGFYALDGGSIRLCTEQGYEGDDEIFALQVIEGNIRAAYNYDELVYEVRNPRTDVTACGYGYSETEMLIRIVTYLLNTLSYNASFFDKNSIPRGFLNLYGNYSKEDLTAFKRYWKQMTSGASNHHQLPVMVSKDNESKADYVAIDGALDEMAFSKWLTFLTSIACAVYGVAPEEISMESYATQSKGLGGSDTEEKLVSANDKGLRPLLSFYEDTFSDYIVQVFSEDYMFRFVGLDEEDKKQAFEAQKLAMNWNEIRAKVGLDPLEGDSAPLGEAPINPSLIPMWQSVTGIGQPAEDFGDPDEFPAGGDEPQPGDQPEEEEDDGYGVPPAAGDEDPDAAAAGGADDGEAMAKALASDYGLAPPIYTLDD